MLLQHPNVRVNDTAWYKITPLHVAARFACPKVVELLINDPRVKVDATTDLGFTALHLVAEGDENPDRDLGSRRPQEDRCKVVHMLLQAQRTLRSSDVGCHLNRSDDFKRFPIHYGVECDSVEVVEELLKWDDIDINAQDIHGLTPLHLAIQSKADNREAIVKLLLHVENIDINMGSGMPSTNQKLREWEMPSNWRSEYLPFRPMEQEGSTNLTALHFAARTGSPEIVDLLFREPGIKINVQDDDGEEGNVDEVKVVVDHVKSYLKEENNEKNTPLHLAAEGGHAEVVQLLLERCSTLDLEVKNAHGNTLLHQATMNGHDKVVQVLLDHAATEFDLDDQNNDGNTPLHLAAKEGHVELVRVLLGCALELQLHAVNKDENTPLHLAIKGGYLEVVKVFLEHADGEKLRLYSTNGEGNSPLHLAIEEGHVEVVKQLLERAGTKLNLNTTNYGDNTPLHLAAEAGQDEIVAMLLALDAPKQTTESDSTEMNNDQRRTTKLNLNATNKEQNTPLHLAFFIDAANALLVGGALIAGITFASWLQPPLGYTIDYQFPQSSLATPPGVFESFAAVELHYSLRLFWVFNTLSFFFAIGTVISGAKAAFPDLDTTFIVVALRSVRKELQWTSILLLCSVVTVLGAFVCAGFAVLPPIHKYTTSMKISVVIGLAICSWTIIRFL
ncbi:unnamed protein product, partial [Sphagnum jensenii]